MRSFVVLVKLDANKINADGKKQCGIRTRRVGYECYGEECGLGQLVHTGIWYGVLCLLYSVTYE
jgi:hypothetical protein